MSPLSNGSKRSPCSSVITDSRRFATITSARAAVLSSSSLRRDFRKPAFTRATFEPIIPVVETPREAVKGVDIVLCATNTNVPLFDGDWLEPGQHVTSRPNFGAYVSANRRRFSGLRLKTLTLDIGRSHLRASSWLAAWPAEPNSPTVFASLRGR